MSSLASHLASRIAGYISHEGLAPGTRLPERKLAGLFNVSRSPIRDALKLLSTRRIVRSTNEGGYCVERDVGDADLLAPDPDDEALYLAIADDHLSGTLAEKVSENALMRRYGLRRGALVRVLHRAAEEGWVERCPGHGWAFLPVLTSPQAYLQSYRFRILIEPAGLLEPTFLLDRAALLRCRAQQQEVVETQGRGLPPPALFAIGSHFHTVLIRCSQNAFLIDALERVNRLRRLIEYRKIVDLQTWLARCREHIDLIDLVLDGNRAAAADFLRRHLEHGAAAKANSI